MLRIAAILIASLGLALAGHAERAALDEGTEITRDPAEIDALLADPVDPDFLDTALVFHNSSGGPALVGCTGHSRNGVGLGRAFVKIPAGGVRHLLASDLSDDTDFVGSASCAFRGGRVIGTGFIVAPNGVTRTRVVPRGHRIKFAVVAHR